MGRKDLSRLRASLKTGMEIDSSINSLTDKRDSLNRSKRKRESEIEKLGSSSSLVIDPSALTVKRLKQILGHNDLPTRGVKKELVARLKKNNISLQHEPEFNVGLAGYNEEKLPELAGRVKLLKSQVKEQELLLEPLKKMKHKADSRVKKAEKSWFYSDEDMKHYIAIVCGVVLAFSITYIMTGLDDAGIIDVFGDEGEIEDGFFGSLYSLLVVFSCCILPFMGGALVAIFPSMFDPASVAVKLQNSAKEELRKGEVPLNTSLKELAYLEGQISRIKQNKREIEKGREQIKKWEVEIEDLNMEISKLRIELEEVYADIKHLLPYSYMLE